MSGKTKSPSTPVINGDAAGSIAANGGGGRKPQLSTEECSRIKGMLTSPPTGLMTFACTQAWAESIMEMLKVVDRRGRRLVKYDVDNRGRLKTKIPKLFEAIADAMVYPPPTDDPAWGDPRNGRYHIGSAMRPCFCEQCTRRSEDGARHVYWPAHYMVGDEERLSYTCAINPTDLDDDSGELLCELGRVVIPSEFAERVWYDDRAWRADKTKRMLIGAITRARRILSRDGIPEQQKADAELALSLRDVLDALVGGKSSAGHRWSQVKGSWRNDALGREKSTVHLRARGLKNLGSLVDFVDLGHSLTEVRGVTQAQSKLIQHLICRHPKEPRPRFARIVEPKTRTGSRK